MDGEKDAWNQFFATGKVEDYLQIVNAKERPKDTETEKKPSSFDEERARTSGFRY